MYKPSERALAGMPVLALALAAMLAPMIAAAGVSALEAGPDAGAAPQVNFTKGGKGLRLIWAAFVLQQHRVHTWTHPDHRNSVGFRLPLVPA